MEYDVLTAQNRVAMLQQRLLTYERSHYDATINLDLLKAAGKPDGELQPFQQKIDELDAAHARTKAKLDQLQAQIAKADA